MLVPWSLGILEYWRKRNPKQITMTKIVLAALGIPTLRAGPQFENSKTVLVIEY